MKNKAPNTLNESHDFEGLSDRELAEAFIFPSIENTDKVEKKEDEDFWKERQQQFESRSKQQKIYDKLLQLKFQLEDYVTNQKYDADANFGFFLNEYINGLEKQDKQFAADIDVKPAVLSGYINNHRKPPHKIIIRLELHSNGIIPAHIWYRLLQKDKEHQIKTDEVMRKEESSHVKNKLQLFF
ncbi:hypothetical protein [Dyadobacter sp. CY356]|uniref:hypothetical protein n=1 Tax=Dyadobacter sp. CY356 TaxID=2906442 RepID=UPI001F1E7A2D|nr:hypothetical protein [Dyadobacter sp. CY356]MCF0056039.1 hypothetical protein [Dyadobacter sp. CY356]